MDKFNFGRTVEICGKQYTIDVLREDVRKQIPEMKKTLDRLQRIPDSENEQILLMRDTVDLILGTGSFDDIASNSGVEMSVLNVSRLIQFLADEINIERIQMQRAQAAADKIINLHKTKK